MIIRLARRILGIRSETDIDDPIYYNSKQYTNARHSNSSYFRKILNRVQKPAEDFYGLMKEKDLLSNDLRIIDVGCGSGNLLNLISSGFPSASLTGADFSESKINHCRSLYPHIDFTLGDIYDELNPEYDLVLCTEVLEHLLYPHKALKNLVHGLKNRGVVFITVPNGRLDSFAGHINFWSPESWIVFHEGNLTDGYEFETGIIFSNRVLYSIIRKH
jgi:2-polyprenyl-3-methyl-5-hydroxy-6-metoxy-1,4-benzoquinol methylase